MPPNNNRINAKTVDWINGESQVNYKEVKKGKWMNVKDTWLSGTGSACQQARFYGTCKLLQKEEKKNEQ